MVVVIQAFQEIVDVPQFHDSTWCLELTRKSIEASKEQEAAGTSVDLR